VIQDTLNDIGALRLQQNRTWLAERYHRQALRKLQQHKAEEKSIAETLALLADTQTAQGKYDAALRNYHEALKHQESKAAGAGHPPAAPVLPQQT